MRFILRRTSDWIGENKPCEEAIRIIVPDWHTRTVSEEEFNNRFSKSEGLWRSKGTEHATTKEGYITRREADKEVWGINLKTLKDFLDFINKYGKCVVSYEKDNRSLEIEIYDDYRE